MRRVSLLLLLLCILTVTYIVNGQQIGTNTPESHPSLSTYVCDANAICTKQTNTKIVLDANWRWVHEVGNYDACYNGNTWASICNNGATCAAQCALEGADYVNTYGITTTSDSLRLNFKTNTNIGSRVYLMSDDNTYQIFHLKNKEFAFTVDDSQLGCGLNGALYFVEMPSDGGKGAYSSNQAGAKYGTGYCDAQCPQDVKFINGEANSVGWTPTTANSGNGNYGACCIEMDIWEANKMSAAFTPHPCDTVGLERCEGVDCGAGSDRYNGLCDKDGCDFNSYRQGVTDFFGPSSSFTIDTTKPVTVVTQFITDDGSDDGDLVEMRRIYVQNDVVIQNSVTTWPTASKPFDSITDEFCTDQKNVFGDHQDFIPKGGMSAMGDAFDRGMVLVMSLWDDYASSMLWLDSTYPTNDDVNKAGVGRGTCATSSGVPADVESQQGSAYVKFSAIKWGPIGSTTPGVSSATTSNGGASSSSSTTAKSATSSSTSATSSTTTATSSSSATSATSSSSATSATSSSPATSSTTAATSSSSSTSATSSSALGLSTTTTTATGRNNIQTSNAVSVVMVVSSVVFTITVVVIATLF